MKYKYKQTNIVVESDSELDSTLFIPLNEATSEAEKKDNKTIKAVKKKS